jgi:hypothetical protein
MGRNSPTAKKSVLKTKGEAMEPKKKFAAETVLKLQQSLDQVAPYQAAEFSKQQAIRALSPQIVALRDKGYGWTAVAAMLTERGVCVSVAGLRTYLRRVREEAQSEAPRTAAKRLRDGRTGARQKPPPSAASAWQNRQPPPASKLTQPAADAASAAADAPHPIAPAPRREEEPCRSTLALRSDLDTKDI